MLIVVSPAKRLDWSERDMPMTEPAFRDQANRLASHARQLPLKTLKFMMSLSDDLAKLSRARFRDFVNDPGNDITRPALFAFAGDTYQGLDAGSLDDETIARAQRRLRILSGLYGVLRPLDAIQPYRLEMGSRLKTRRGSNLYQFWGDRLSKSLNEAADEIDTDTLVNCASNEYFSAVDRNTLKPRVVTPEFYEVKPGAQPKIISFFAKKARGSMARFIVEYGIDTVDGMKDFDLGGYRFVESDEEGTRLIFHRDYNGKNA